MSGPANHPAGNFWPCVSGGLRREIIRAAVYYNSPAYDFTYGKPASQDLAACPAVITEQGRKIACMLRMWLFLRIKMAACVWKACAGAVPALVNVESKEARC